MTTLNEVQLTIAKQIHAGILAKRGLRFITLDENSIRLNKGKKNMDIHYNVGTDMYDVETHVLKPNLSVKSDEIKDRMWVDLTDMIDQFFNLKGLVNDVISLKMSLGM